MTTALLLAKFPQWEYPISLLAPAYILKVFILSLPKKFSFFWDSVYRFWFPKKAQGYECGLKSHLNDLHWLWTLKSWQENEEPSIRKSFSIALLEVLFFEQLEVCITLGPSVGLQKNYFCVKIPLIQVLRIFWGIFGNCFGIFGNILPIFRSKNQNLIQIFPFSHRNFSPFLGFFFFLTF